MAKRATKKYDDPYAKWPKDGLVIAAGWQGDGGTYRLRWESEERIREVFPDTLVNPVVFLGYDKTGDFHRFHKPYWETVARILTGLTPEQIAQLGGVRIVDTEGHQVLWEWQTPSKAQAG